MLRSNCTYLPATKYRKSQFWQPPSCHLKGQCQTPTTGRQCFHQYQHEQYGEWGPPGGLTTIQTEGWNKVVLLIPHVAFKLHKDKQQQMHFARMSWWWFMEDLHDRSPLKQQMQTLPALAGNKTLQGKICYYFWIIMEKLFCDSRSNLSCRHLGYFPWILLCHYFKTLILGIKLFK